MLVRGIWLKIITCIFWPLTLSYELLIAMVLSIPSLYFSYIVLLPQSNFIDIYRDHGKTFFQLKMHEVENCVIPSLYFWVKSNVTHQPRPLSPQPPVCSVWLTTSPLASETQGKLCFGNDNTTWHLHKFTKKKSKAKPDPVNRDEV